VERRSVLIAMEPADSNEGATFVASVGCHDIHTIGAQVR